MSQFAQLLHHSSDKPRTGSADQQTAPTVNEYEPVHGTDVRHHDTFQGGFGLDLGRLWLLYAWVQVMKPTTSSVDSAEQAWVQEQVLQACT